VTDIRATDVHAHAIPPAAVAAIERHGDRYGMSVAHTEQGPVVTLPGRRKVRPIIGGLLDFEERVRLMDERGVTRQLVSPWTDLQGFELLPQAGADWARLMNDALAEACAPASERLIALGTVPFGEVGASVRELERLTRELHMPGVMISTNPGDTSLADPYQDEVWAAAESLGVPIILHPPSMGPSAAVPDTGDFGNLWLRLIDTTLVATRLILNGVLDRHPRLKIVLVHGGGFLPFQIGRLDRSVLIGQPPAQLAAGAPAEYLRRFHYDTCAMSPDAIRLLASACGADRLLMGSDYPFPIGDPDPIARVHAAQLDPSATQGVLGANWAALAG
jgi:aminocarboxymuconate-semialdehyde decarboxylase